MPRNPEATTSATGLTGTTDTAERAEEMVDQMNRRLHEVRQERHGDCFACGDRNTSGLHLECQPQPDGAVEAEFSPQPWMAGYNHRIHGGLIATLLDSAMTQCLFAHGVEAVTATFNLRYRNPAYLGRDYRVRACIEEDRHRLFRMRAELRCDGQRIADAEAQFVPQPHET